MSDDRTRQDWDPVDADVHERQIAGLLARVDAIDHEPVRILDLGCGSGRVLLPLAAHGCDGIGLDHERTAIEVCQHAISERGVNATVAQHDFVTSSTWPDIVRDHAPFDVICCLGHTFMLVSEPRDALALMRRVRDLLHQRHGLFIIDDIPGELWPLLAGGDWCAGISEDDSMQMVWHARDNVFVLREGDAIDEEADGLVESFMTTDRPNRLWTMGELQLLAIASGFDRIECDRERVLIVFDA